MAKEKNNITRVVIAIVILALIICIVLVIAITGKTRAEKTLEELYSEIEIHTLPLRKENVDLSETDLSESLPDISMFPFAVAPETSDYIEIYSSPEKTGKDYESWLIDAAESFNKSGVKINGRAVSVGVRSIQSGLGFDYILSGKYKPDLFSPSNEFWGDMLIYKGVNVNLLEKRLAGNVTGIILSNDKYSEFMEEYGYVDAKIIVEAVLQNKLIMGYTDPFTSSTGLNFLLTTLYTLNSDAPLSKESVSKLQQFQDNIPFVAYNTMQMKISAQSGSLEGFVLAYQTYVNSPDIKLAYEFIPFGERVDNPVYEIGELSAVKKEIAVKFIDYCKTAEMQKLATDKGFNGYNDYVYGYAKADGATISAAQQIWKKEKNGTRDLTVVFVADISGSMDGMPLAKLKDSLNSASKYILPETHVGLVTFSDSVNIALPIAKFDLNQRSYFTGAVKDMQAGGGTAMFDAIIAASKMLMDAKEENPNTKLMLFVLTDGETNMGNTFYDVEKILRDLKIPIYTIGYNANISILRELSEMNEAANINAETDDVIYKLMGLFNAQT